MLSRRLRSFGRISYGDLRGHPVNPNYVLRGHPVNPNYVLHLANTDADIGADIGADIRAEIGAEIRAEIGAEIGADIGAEYTLTFDGACRGNPGMCGAGYVIWKNGDIFVKGQKYICDCGTNNFAEYWALIVGLQKCVALKITHVNVKGDSLLVIKQITKEFKISSENLLPLYAIVMDLLDDITVVSCVHIPRAENKHADRLANEAIDTFLEKIRGFPP